MRAKRGSVQENATLQSPTSLSSRRLSQKERKRLAREQETAASASRTSPSSNPWKITSASPKATSMESLADFSKLKLESSPPFLAASPPAAAFRRNSDQNAPWKSPSASSPWGSRASFSASTPPFIPAPGLAENDPEKVNLTKSFLDIQKEQVQHAEHTLKMKKQPRKSLLRIQLEENAINQLREFYSNTCLPFGGEYTIITTKQQ